jgi:hypothetical protein
MNDVWWKYFLDVAQGLGTIDLTSQVTGILPGTNGGTGANNGARTFAWSGFNLSFTLGAATSLSLPSTGALMASKAERVTTGSIAAGASALVTLTWAVAFADANYTAVASVLDATAAAASLRVVHVESVTAAAVGVRVENTSAGALTGTVQVIGMHD